jgi:hypothetical protein
MILSKESQQVEKNLEAILIYLDESLLTILINMEVEKQKYLRICSGQEEWSKEWNKQQELKKQLENSKSSLVLPI